MRDANGATGERGQSPHWRQAVVLSGGKTDRPGEFALILAGLHEGTGRLLQKITNVERTIVAGASGVSLVTAVGGFAYSDIDETKFEFDVEFEKDRVLPLLGMGEPGKEASNAGGGPAQPGFLDRLKGSLSQTVWVKRFDKAVKSGAISPPTRSSCSASRPQASKPKSCSRCESIYDLPGHYRGRCGTVGPEVAAHRGACARPGLGRRAERRPRSGPPTTKSRCSSSSSRRRRAALRAQYEGDGRADGAALRRPVFGRPRRRAQGRDPSDFAAGLDLTAKASGEPVRLNGIDVPFRFTTGELVIKRQPVAAATIGGRGSLPRDLVGEADCTIPLDFKQDANSNASCCNRARSSSARRATRSSAISTRFTLTINDLDIAFVRDDGYHFYFLVTGALEFTPRAANSRSGCCSSSRTCAIDLERTPLTADPAGADEAHLVSEVAQSEEDLLAL